jgi:hypothetical protein
MTIESVSPPVLIKSLGSALTYTIDGGRGRALVFNFAGASDAHKKVK